MEAVAEAGRHALDSECGDARRGELDRERDPVEVPANGGRRRRPADVGHVLWLGRARARDEEPDRPVPQYVFGVLAVFPPPREPRPPGDALSGRSPPRPAPRAPGGRRARTPQRPPPLRPPPAPKL